MRWTACGDSPPTLNPSFKFSKKLVKSRWGAHLWTQSSVLTGVTYRIQTARNQLKRVWLAALTVTAVMTMVLSQPPLVNRASRFLYYLETSRHADGVSGQITLWERVIYSFILAG